MFTVTLPMPMCEHIAMGQPLTHSRNAANGDIWVYNRRRLDPRLFPWQWHNRCHLLPVMMNIDCFKFGLWAKTLHAGAIILSPFINIDQD